MSPKIFNRLEKFSNCRLMTEKPQSRLLPVPLFKPPKVSPREEQRAEDQLSEGARQSPKL